MANAPQVNANLYAPPKAAVDDVGQAGLGQAGSLESLGRFTTWAVVGLAIVTLGIYLIYWLFVRTKRLSALIPQNPIKWGVCCGKDSDLSFESLLCGIRRMARTN